MTAKKKRKKKKNENSLKNLFFILTVFTGLAILFVLLIPTRGFVNTVRVFFYDSMGYLSFFVPLLLFQTGAWILRLRAAEKGYRIVAGGFLIAYFLASIVSLIGSRFSLAFVDAPGGHIAGGLAEAVLDLLGAPIAYLTLLTCFIATLVVVTGWDLVEDFGRIVKFFGSLRDSRKKKTGAVRIPDSLQMEAVPDVASVANVWSKQKKTVPEVFPPFAKSDDRKPVSSGSRKSVQSTKPLSAGERTGESLEYVLPEDSFLTVPPPVARTGQSEREIRERADLLIEKLADFGVECEFACSYPGPVLTRFELIPGPGVKINRILNLADDLALALAAKRIRILAPVPGKGAVGIEVPNPEPETVYLGEIIEKSKEHRLPIALGKRLEGEPFATDICRMPHLLIAGATGSGKSICIHSIICTVLMTKTPHEVRLALVDPKMLELSVYEGIPHLWAPIILETSKAKILLDALVAEMETRYSRLARQGVRSITEFNDKITAESEDERIPYIILIIDELADLMMVSANEVETPIARLAQMSRAVGIHLVVATQRPSVDVITGMIKANFPSRIAFNVQSKTDSRTILDMNGAEKLLGNGDMLFLPSASPEPHRIHGSYISTDEIRRIVNHWQKQPSLPFEFVLPEEEAGNLRAATEIKLDDPLLQQAQELVIKHQQGSVSLLQRRLRVGYARAARLIDMLEQIGVVGPFLGSKARDVLIQPETEPLPDEDEDENNGEGQV